MSCPIPIRIINPHYRKIASLSADYYTTLSSFNTKDDFYIDVPCGKCYHCRKSYKTQWNLRLQLEYKYLTPSQRNNSYFVTLTFDDDNLPSSHPTKDDISPLIRKFLERVRKKYKCSVRHWIVSEYGDNTQRFHLHGLFFDIPFPIWTLESLWKYGFVTYKRLTTKRITYVTTYVNKQLKGLLEDPLKRQFVFSSPGIGKQLIDDPSVTNFTHQHNTIVPFVFHNNRPFAMPRYFRSKLFSDDELKELRNSYFFYRSESLVPPPPYFLGRNRYTDYTLYLKDCEVLRQQYNTKYKKSKSILYGEQQPQPDFTLA